MAYKTTSFVQGLTEASSVAKQDLGTIRDEGDKGYKYVQYESGAGTVAGTAGRVAVYDATDGYGSSLVTCDNSDGNGVGAGYLMATLADGEYGWIQIWGESGLLETDVTAGAVGNGLTAVGAGDGTLDVSGLVTDTIVASLLDATASAQVILCNFPR